MLPPSIDRALPLTKLFDFIETTSPSIIFGADIDTGFWAVAEDVEISNNFPEVRASFPVMSNAVPEVSFCALMTPAFPVVIVLASTRTMPSSPPFVAPVDTCKRDPEDKFDPAFEISTALPVLRSLASMDSIFPSFTLLPLMRATPLVGEIAPVCNFNNEPVDNVAPLLASTSPSPSSNESA